MFSVGRFPTCPGPPFQAYVSLIRYWNWKTFTVIYEDIDGLVRLQEVLKAPSSSQFKITLRQLPADSTDYRCGGDLPRALDCGSLRRCGLLLKGRVSNGFDRLFPARNPLSVLRYDREILHRDLHGLVRRLICKMLSDVDNVSYDGKQLGEIAHHLRYVHVKNAGAVFQTKIIVKCFANTSPL